jgi:hypothetical protein
VLCSISGWLCFRFLVFHHMEKRSLKECLHGASCFSQILQKQCLFLGLSDLTFLSNRSSEDAAGLEDQVAGCHRHRGSTGERLRATCMQLNSIPVLE